MLTQLPQIIRQCDRNHPLPADPKFPRNPVDLTQQSTSDLDPALHIVSIQ
jgi:hypothetical protein